MNATNDTKENRLEFSRAHFAEQQAAAAGDSSELGGRIGGGSDAVGLLENGLSGAGLPRGPWQGWFSRGIPELASPLAG
jgi:hypothetical protein